MKKHPFLDTTLTPNWQSMSADDVIPDIELALKQTKEKIHSIANQDKSKISYDSTLLALDNATELLHDAWNKVSHLDSVCNSPELRKSYNQMLPKVSEFFTQIYLDPNLWETVKAFSLTDEAKKLSGDHKRFLEETLQDFRESGADLLPEKKSELKKIDAELAQLTQKFSENVLDATKDWELIIDDESLLEGLPQTAKDIAQENALKKGHGTEEKPKWRFSLQAPSYVPILQYLKDDSIREKVWRAVNSVGHKEPYDNSNLIKKVLDLRQRKATILGFNNFADLILKRRMSKSGIKALKFIEDLHDRILSIFREEVKSLEDYKANKEEKQKGLLQPWEVAYWAEKRRKELYDFDEEELRPYFPIHSVIDGLFKITQKLFSITIKQRTDVEGWHEDVQYYEILEKDGRLLGAFYADWHPREEKRGGAWMNHLLTGGKHEPHLGLICGNLTQPTKDKPALLTHREVETIFHEFGHLLHHLFGDVEVKALHGTQVAWDFVELPSQIMENWCWERESLDLFARHYKTGEPIPEDLFKKVKAARNYLSGMDTMRQLSIAKMDLELHINFIKKPDQDLDQFLDQILETYIPKYKTKPPTLIRRLGHVFGDPTGYAAGYYSYKWAEVLDADAFTRFKEKGILNEEVGLDFREKILSKGNSIPADELFRAFMGRDPQLEALLKRSGLLKNIY